MQPHGPAAWGWIVDLCDRMWSCGRRLQGVEFAPNAATLRASESGAGTKGTNNSDIVRHPLSKFLKFASQIKNLGDHGRRCILSASKFRQQFLSIILLREAFAGAFLHCFKRALAEALSWPGGKGGSLWSHHADCHPPVCNGKLPDTWTIDTRDCMWWKTFLSTSGCRTRMCWDLL